MYSTPTFTSICIYLIELFIDSHHDIDPLLARLLTCSLMNCVVIWLMLSLIFHAFMGKYFSWYQNHFNRNFIYFSLFKIEQFIVDPIFKLSWNCVRCISFYFIYTIAVINVELSDFSIISLSFARLSIFEPWNVAEKQQTIQFHIMLLWHWNQFLFDLNAHDVRQVHLLCNFWIVSLWNEFLALLKYGYASFLCLSFSSSEWEKMVS